jgi:streptomycin 6-kinase
MNSTKRMALLAALMAALVLTPLTDVDSAEPSAALATPESFDGINDTAARSAGLFTEAAKVLTSPRCLNCHPAGDRPLQGETHRLHQPPVERGSDGFGAVTMRCATCHQSANFDPAGMPGHPNWHLAPREMAWQDRKLAEICAQIKDPARNGGRSPEQILTHIATDTLVDWAWAPGFGRQPAPGTQRELGALIEAWMKTGAVCPM